VVVFGHNMSPLPGAASVFGPLVSYSDPAFMAEHLVVLFSQRGGRTLELRVVATEVCAGTAARKGAGFKTRAALMAWYEGRMAQAQTVAQDVPDTDGISQVFTFVTCSYGSKDERTLVYAVAVRESEVPVGSAHIRPGPTEPLASLRLPEPRTGLECY
jgi:hypothetical protein